MANLITEKKFRFDLPAGKRKERIDLFLANSLENASRTRVQKLIDWGYVSVNGKIVKANHKITAFDVIEVAIPCSPRPEKAEPEEIPIDVVYEDEYLLLVNKPPGLVVHPSFAHFTGTLVNALLFHTKKLSPSEDEVAIRPGIVHRIDKDTSGLLVIAKDEVSHARLAAQFAAHSAEREYWTVVWGVMKDPQGTIETLIARSKKDRKKFAVSKDEGKLAITTYEVIEYFEFATLLRVRLKTGRTHQIRVHFSSLGHPVFGDETYGGRTLLYGSQLPKMKSRLDNLLEVMPRQALHAKTLGFTHPQTREFMRFNSELPPDMELLLEKLRM